MKVHLFWLWLLVAFNCYAQKQASVWYFGNNAGLDFRNGDPVPLTDGALSTFEGSASICDEAGNLLFYTDGVTVYNRMHIPMPNGKNLWGSFTTTQTLIVPQPESQTIFYIFTASPQFDYIFVSDSVGFHYSVIDVSLNNGLGDVTEKNILLFEKTTEKISAVHHADGINIWVVSHEWGNNTFKSYLVTKNGISNKPVMSSIGSVHNGGVFKANSVGQMKLSSDGSKLALVIGEQKKIEAFMFDKIAGKITFLISSFTTQTDLGFIWSLEFSPDNNLMYFTTTTSNCGFNDPDNPSELWQYSFVNKKPIRVGEFIGTLNSLQLAINGKIYISRCNDIIGESDYMAEITYPNRVGEACGFVSKGVSLNGRNNQIGLPNFIQSYFQFSDAVFDLPNFFSPNGDEFNSFFKPTNTENLIAADLRIINRWGQEVFHTTDVALGWDGGDAASGVYYWFLFYEGKNGKTGTRKGWVQLAR